ncbi:MAG: TonB-dependent receptor, partial [Caulobacterales bacterium]|nr:TonB-dependent receptor [Caulobacterales bacterium]
DGRQEETFDDFSPRVSVDYQFTDYLFGYASWSRGFRSGGFSGRAGDIIAATTPFDPETVDSYEVGVRSEWLDNALRLNGTIFLADYSDKQEDVVVALPVAPFQATVVQNAAAASYFGVELDSQWAITDSLSLNGTFSYLDAEYDDFPTLFTDPVTGETSIRDQSGLELRRAPDFTYSIGANYGRQVGFGQLNADISWRWVDDFQLTIVNANPLVGPQISPVVEVDMNGEAFQDPRGVSEAAGILNASVGYDFEVNGTMVGVSVFGRNLSDSVRGATFLPVAGLFNFGSNSVEPRSFGGSLSVEF